jgi:uncharacterized protein (TIGR02594 family)
MNVTAYDIALRFTGIKEVSGQVSHPQILSFLTLDSKWPKGDHVPWCSAFVNWIAWILNLPRSKSLRARSWLQIGIPRSLDNAVRGFDVVILSRGSGKQPGPSVINAPGHVGFYVEQDSKYVYLLGGNQKDSVNVSPYSKKRVLGVRSLHE